MGSATPHADPMVLIDLMLKAILANWEIAFMTSHKHFPICIKSHLNYDTNFPTSEKEPTSTTSTMHIHCIATQLLSPPPIWVYAFSYKTHMSTD